MAKKKKKRIKRLKAVALWPLFIFMIFMMGASLFIASSIGDTYLVFLLDSKITNGYTNASYVASIAQDIWTDSDKDNLSFDKDIVHQASPNVLNVVYLNIHSKEIYYSINEEDPFESDFIPYGNIASAGLTDMFVGFADSNSDLIEIYAGDANINTLNLLSTSFGNLHNTISEVKAGTSLSTLPLAETELWYMYPTDPDTNLSSLSNSDFIFVKYKIQFTTSDLFTMLAVYIMMFVLIAMFLIFDFVAFVTIILDRRKLLRTFYLNPVTGGRNWEYFLKISDKIRKKNKKSKKNLAIVHLRMERYRNYCAFHGVDAGEKLVASFERQILYRMNKKNELAVNHEKADFAIMMCYTEKDELVERIDQIVASLMAFEEDHALQFSVGICEIDDPSIMTEELYNNAGVARSTITEGSDHRVAWYNDEMREKEIWQHRVTSEMERAIENHEFVVYLQPKYSTKEEKLSAAEALIRWIHPEEGFIPPNRFIPIFEGNGYITKIDDYMLHEVSRIQAKWMEEGKQLVPISVNISRAHFAHDNLAQHITGIVDQYKIPHEYIELELTESAFFDDKATLLRTLKELREAGFPISMDDFGAGYSSLNSLKELPLDIVKLDADFFRGNDEMNHAELIVSETIHLAKKLDMRIVAEGIETREQVDFLAQEGCDLIQGYYFAKPMPVDEFDKEAYQESSTTQAENETTEETTVESTKESTVESTVESTKESTAESTEEAAEEVTVESTNKTTEEKTAEETSAE